MLRLLAAEVLTRKFEASSALRRVYTLSVLENTTRMASATTPEATKEAEMMHDEDDSEDDLQLGFSQAKEALHEIAIVDVKWSAMSGLGTEETRYDERMTMLNANRESLAEAVFDTLKVPSAHWGRAVEPRALFVQGSERPWQISIATLKSGEGMEHLFGRNRDKTHMLRVEVRCMVDAKAREYTTRTCEVEVGAAGSYDVFNTLGKRGKRVIQHGDATTGRILVATLDRHPRAWDYHDPDWQRNAAACAIAHVSRALTAHLDPTKVPTQVVVSQFAVEPIVPVTASVDVNQSAKGVRVHLLVRGVYFDAVSPPPADLTAAAPIPLTGRFLNGQVSADGLTPKTQKDIPVRFSIANMADSKVHEGSWYPPASLSSHPEAKARGQSVASVRHAGMRSKRRQERRAQWREDAEEGEVRPSFMGGHRGGYKKPRGDPGAGSSSAPWADRSASEALPPAPANRRGSPPGGVASIDLR